MAFKPHVLPQRNCLSHGKPPLPTLEVSFRSPAKASMLSFPTMLLILFTVETPQKTVFLQITDEQMATRRLQSQGKNLLKVHPSNCKRRFPVRKASRDGTLAEFWIICLFSIMEAESSTDRKVVGCRGNRKNYTGSFEYGLFVLGLMSVCVLVTQLCQTLCNPMDWLPMG